MSSHRDELDRMASVEMRAAFVMLGEQKRLKKLIVRHRKKGEEIKVSKAINDLILDGEKRGREQGERIGEKRGEQRGQERMASLIVVLKENHKDDLIIKAASDRILRKRLLQEYNL